MPWSLKDAKNPSEAELDKLFRAAKKAGPDERLICSLTYNAALRVSELIHIKAGDFNFQTGKLTMIPLKKAGKKRIRQADGTIKTVDKPLPRAVEYPLPSVVLPLIKDYIKAKSLKLGDWLLQGNVGPGGCHIVKLECPGGHASKRKIQGIFDGLLEAAGIKLPGRGIHSLKHGRLTEVARKEKDPYLVKEVGRHSSISLSDHYVKYVDLQERIEKIGGRS